MKSSYRYLNILIIALVVVLAIMYFLPKGNKYLSRDFAEIKESGVLNIVTEYNSVDYHISGDTIAGIQYELCKYIANRSGLEVNTLLENSLEASVKGLEAGRYDVIARHIPITNENKEQLAFTVPIFRNKQVLVQRASGDSTHIDSQLDLADKEVYISLGSPVKLRLNNLSEEIAEPIHIIETPDYTSEQLIYRVAFGEIDYAVVDKAIAQANKELFPTIDIDTDISFTQWQAWAVRKDSPVLLDSLNAWIESLMKLKVEKGTRRRVDS